MKAYLALFKSNLQLTLRDSGVLFFNYLFPFIFFFAFAELFDAGTGAGIAYFVGTVLTMGILGNGLWGAGMRAVQEREANILRRFKVTPISPAAHPGRGHGERLAALPARRCAAARPGAFPIRHAVAAALDFTLLMVSLGVCAFRAIGLILASVTNTMQEAMIAIQLLYMPMLFLSGATVPSAHAAQMGADAGGIHAGVLPGEWFSGNLLPQPDRSRDSPLAVGALLLTIVLGLFLARAAFPLGEGGKDPRRATSFGCWPCSRPFVLMGCYQAYSKEHLGNNQALYRDLQRAGTFLIRNARIFTGDGKVIENGAVLVRDGKIAEASKAPARIPTKSGSTPWKARARRCCRD